MTLRRAAAAFACAAILILLTSLGGWQLQRMAWKHRLIADVDARIAAPVAPAPLPGAPAVDQAYRHVTVSGHFLNDRETLVQAVTRLGAGFWVVTPMTTDRGFTVLVNRGFVPPDRRDPRTRLAGQNAGYVEVDGLLRLTEPKGGFLRRNDPATGRWYSRDVAAIAQARQLGTTAPYFIDADATPNHGGLPVGGLTVVAFPDNHLQYALTWFALSAMFAGWLIYGRLRPASRERRSPRP